MKDIHNRTRREFLINMGQGTAALDLYWGCLLLGKPEDARKTLERFRARGIPLPDMSGR